MDVGRAPILMIQWGPPGEPNELESIEDRLGDYCPQVLHPRDYRSRTENEAFREWVVRQHVGYDGDALQDWLRAESVVLPQIETHDIVSLRVTDAAGATLIARLTSLLTLVAAPQVVYFSCHGTVEQLSFDQALTSRLSFQDFGTALSGLREDCVSLVLGCCHGLDEQSTILEHIPSQVCDVYGFTREPSCFDVASLMLGVLLDGARLFREVSDANTATFAEGVLLSDFDKAAAQFGTELDQILDQFAEDPSAHVRGEDGVGIRWLKRVEYDGRSVWQGRTIPLRNR